MVGTGEQVGNGAVLSKPIVAQQVNKTEIVKIAISFFITIVILSTMPFF
jgi:hypothetical protein